jgi:pimeloyl-ACP methyl ester carboxylesterase
MYHYSRICGIKTRWLKLGKGMPLVLIPGWRTDIERFYALVEVIADYFTVYTLDLPGTGKTEPLNKRHTLINYSGFVASWISRLDQKKFILGGVSMGCPIAVYTFCNPSVRKRAKAAFLMLPVYNQDSYNLNRVARTGIRISSSILKRKPFSNIGDRVYRSEKLMKHIVNTFEREPALKISKNMKYHLDSFKRFSFRVSMETMNDLVKFNLGSLQEKLDVPAVVIMSSKDPLLRLPQTVNGYRKIFSKLYIEELDTPFHVPRTVPTKKYINRIFEKSISRAHRTLMEI